MRSFIFFVSLVSCFSLQGMPSAPPPPIAAAPSVKAPVPMTMPAAPAMPSVKTPTPMAMPVSPVPVPTVTVQTSNAMPSQAQPVSAASKAVPTDNADKLVLYRKELRELKDRVDSVDTKEAELLQQLKQLDDEVESATRLALETRKASIKILSIDAKSGSSGVEASFNKLKKNIAEIEKIQQNIDSKLSPKFESILGQIKSSMQKAQQDLVQLKEKGKALGLPTDTIKTEEAPKVEKTKPSVKLKKKGTKSYIFDLGVNIVATVATYAKKIIEWFMDLFNTGIAQSKKEIQPGIASGVAVAKSPAGVSTDPVLSKVRVQEQQIDEKIKKLSKEKKEIEARRANLEKIRKERSQQITKKLEMMQQLGVQGTVATVQVSGWKHTAQYMFGKFLDGVAFVFGKIKEYSMWFYKNYLQKSVNNFIDAVKKKIHRIEEKEPQAEQKSAAAVSKTVQPKVEPKTPEPVLTPAPMSAPSEMPAPASAPSGMPTTPASPVVPSGMPAAPSAPMGMPS